SVVMCANDQAHAAGPGSKARMPEDAANEERGLLRRHVQKHKAIRWMAERSLEKMLVAREKGGLLKPVKERQDVVITDTHPSNVLSDYPAMDTRRPKDIALIQWDVFVQDVHAALGREASRPSSSSRAWRASCTASVMAALVSLPPPQRWMMK